MFLSRTKYQSDLRVRLYQQSNNVLEQKIDQGSLSSIHLLILKRYLNKSYFKLLTKLTKITQKSDTATYFPKIRCSI